LKFGDIKELEEKIKKAYNNVYEITAPYGMLRFIYSTLALI